MTREELFDLVKGRLGSGATLQHCLACEACMRALARHFLQDENLWGMTGLAHDLDLDVCASDLSRHTLVAAQVLRENGAPEALVLAVLGHNDKAPRTTPMEKALWVVDHATGIITASALVRPSRSTRDLDVASVRKRMKDKRFAANVKRERILACEGELGIEANAFLLICLRAMDEIRSDLGLDSDAASLS